MVFLPDTRDRPLAGLRPQYYLLYLTIQEFLAAKYLVDTLSSEELRDFVSTHMQDGAWKVVMQFVAGLLAEKKDIRQIFSAIFFPQQLLLEKLKSRWMKIQRNEVKY